jgi:predicted transcriptional regulator
MEFKVRDFRNKGFFLLDDAYLNGYAQLFDPITTVVYLSLCRHVDAKNQMAFPSQELIAKEHNISRYTVIRRLKTLEKANIIRFAQKRSKSGKWLHNTYYLLDKSEWKTKDEVAVLQGSHTVHRVARQLTTVLHASNIKDTHKKDTHIKKEIYKERKIPLNGITPDDISQIAERYRVSTGFVKFQLESLRNYVESTGKKYQDHKAALRNFVLREMKSQINIRQRKGGFVDASV